MDSLALNVVSQALAHEFYARGFYPERYAFKESEHPRDDDGKFEDKGEQGKTSSEVKVKMLTWKDDDGFFKQSKNGEVAQVRAGQKSPSVGDTVEVAGRQFVVAALGSVFTIGKHKWRYLYIEQPKPRQIVPSVPSTEDAMEAMESERARQLGRTGELPGA